MTTFTWKVIALACDTTQDITPLLVTTVTAKCTGVLGYSSASEEHGFSVPNPSATSGPLTSYENLTESQVLDWIPVGYKQVVENSIVEQLQRKAELSVQLPPLPWATA